MDTNAAMEYRPPFRMRFWRWLGFRFAAYAGRPDDDEARYTIHRVFTHWDWRDRLRILVSGNTEIELCVETETLEKFKGARSAAVVLSPGAFYKSVTPKVR